MVQLHSFLTHLIMLNKLGIMSRRRKINENKNRKLSSFKVSQNLLAPKTE